MTIESVWGILLSMVMIVISLGLMVPMGLADGMTNNVTDSMVEAIVDGRTSALNENVLTEDVLTEDVLTEDVLTEDVLTEKRVLAFLDQHQEAPGQVLYKSFITLNDQKQRPWRAIAFNQTFPDGHHNFQLRFVGFPGSVAVDRTQPLQIKTALGQSFTAMDTSDQIFKGETAEATVAQYDLLSMMGKVSTVVPLRLWLPLESGQQARFLILPNVIQEWQSVRNHP